MTLTNRLIAFALLIGLFAAPAGAQTSPFKNLDQVAQGLGLHAFSRVSPSKTVKIAILDNGFRGHQAEIGKTLPASTVYVAGPVAVDPANEEAHGLFMAQIVSGLLAKTPNVRYELHLLSAFGYSNLESAVQKVIDGRFDVVLYSQVWEYGGNGDGRGFINAVVDRAVKAGVLWINAAGNFGDATYRAPVETGADEWAKLPGPNSAVQVRCLQNPKGKCPLRAVLSWNDFKDDVKQGTDKDLDLVLTDDTLKIVRTSGLKQVVTVPEGASGVSLYPREIIQAEVTPGLYFLRVKVRSQNFSKSKDELRLVTSGDYLEQVDKTNAGETLLSPADNAGVVTIGATDSQKSSRAVSLRKPELVTASAFTLSNGETYKGSSNSAAITAAVATLLKAIKPTLRREELLGLVSGTVGGGSTGPVRPEGAPGQGLPLQVLQFAPTGPGCFVTSVIPVLSRPIFAVLRTGAVSVASDAGIKIFTRQDPFLLAPGLMRFNFEDMLVVGPQGFQIAPRGSQRLLPQGTYEVVQQPLGQFICGFPGSGGGASGGPNGSMLRLPSPDRLGL